MSLVVNQIIQELHETKRIVKELNEVWVSIWTDPNSSEEDVAYVGFLISKLVELLNLNAEVSSYDDSQESR